MRRLMDDPLTPLQRPFSRTFFILAGSGQLQGHHLSRERALKVVDRAFWVFAA